MRRYRISDWIELSAKNLIHLPKLEGIVMSLAKEMCSVREQIEMTKSEKLESASRRRDVISLSDDWEVIAAPDNPVPRYAHVDQDERLRRLQTRPKCRC